MVKISRIKSALMVSAVIALATTSSSLAQSTSWVLKMNKANGCVVGPAGTSPPNNMYYGDVATWPDAQSACVGAKEKTDFTLGNRLKCHHFDNASVERCADAGVPGLPGT